MASNTFEFKRKSMDATDTLKKLGIGPSDRIAVCLPVGQPFIDWLLASLEIGAVFCPLNPRLPVEALAQQIDRLAPKLVISPAGIETRGSAAAPLPPASFLIFTSGSTGTPKIASLTHQSFLANARSVNASCDLRAKDGWRLSLPTHHVGGLAIIFRCLLAGAKIVLEDTDLAITHLSCVPAQLYRAWPVYPKLRCLLLGGGPICDVPEELPCLVTYSMTEMASTVMAGKSANTLWPLPGKEIALAPDGEILVRGDSLFEGYWDGVHIQSPCDPHGWFATKDLGHFDPKQGYTIVGRKDNQFISGGENIQPEEIERELLILPEIVEAMVVPRFHEQFGMRPVAFVTTTDGRIDAGKMQQFLAERLPKFKIPDAFFPFEGMDGINLKRDRKKLQEIAKNQKSLF